MSANVVGWRGQIDVDLTDENAFRYVPVRAATGGRDIAQRRAFDLPELNVVATVAVCDVDENPTRNTLPNISMKITQCVRLADESLIRLDMDRGVTSVRHGAAEGEVISWKRPADEVIAEILDLVRTDDEDDPEAHPWDDLAEAARKRGIDVDAATLSGLPYQVLLSAEVVSVFVL
ncbi:hypothetical protein [Pengzhenrongella frigida]|uniref:hypothetical protein n=1 Tax=Pengzhenrongella frigida TaxID=1259133 RepID=UPI001A923FC1|nr:hypothetical protein [Cellulomonas sp. HLT2-17]